MALMLALALTLAPFVQGCGGAFSAAVGDLNRDGMPDLVVPNRFSHDVSILLGR